jgi:hypothetical protein
MDIRRRGTDFEPAWDGAAPLFVRRSFGSFSRSRLATSRFIGLDAVSVCACATVYSEESNPYRSKNMSNRQSVPSELQRDLLLASRRRCAICYGLYGDLGVKKGQIAHLNRNSSQTVFENLVWLCVEHHPEYDGQFNQVKNFTKEEVRTFRSELYSRLAGPSVSIDIERIAHVMRLSRSDAYELRKQLERKDLPVWIRDAAAALGRLVEESPDGVRRAQESRSYLLSIVPYTNIADSLQTVQLEMAKFIDKLGFGTQQRFIEEQFRISITSTSANNSRILYVFPYFHVPFRRRYWGVLPIGHQTSIGFVIHQSHPASAEWDVIAESTRPGASGNPGIMLAEAADWCERLILHTDAGNGAIYWVDGFVFYDILSEALVRRGPEPLASLARRHKSVRPEEQSSLFFSKSGGSVSDFVPDVFVFDPGECDVIRQLIAPEFRLITVPHEVDVPVGIGFSVPFLPRLMVDSHWEAILQEAKRMYAPYAVALDTLGIKLYSFE